MLFKQIKESFFFAIGALWGNKLRSSLSLLGIVIGIFLIITVLSLVDGLKRSVNDSFASLGSDVVFVGKWPWENMGPDYPWWKFMSRPNPTQEDFENIRSRSNLVEDMAFRGQTSTIVKSKKESLDRAQIFGISKEFKDVWSFPIGEGRYFSENESRTGFPVAVLGAEAADDLFPGEKPLGKEITLKGKKVTIVGVLQKEGKGIFGGFNDNAIFVPLQFFKSVVNMKNRDLNTEIIVKVKSGYSVSGLKDELTGIMRSGRRLKPVEDNNFSLNEITIISNQTEALFVVLNLIGILIGGYSIFIGGFGVAQIMFVSVKERTAMIGIQKALGAKRRFILIQFLTESVVLSLIGCFIGLFLVVLVTSIISRFAGFPVGLSLQNALVGTSISVATGLISGIIPAYIASRLDPVEAMRSK